MNNEVLIILDITGKHMQAFREGDEVKRERLLRLLGDFEWAYPDAADEVNKRYPNDT